MKSDINEDINKHILKQNISGGEKLHITSPSVQFGVLLSTLGCSKMFLCDVFNAILMETDYIYPKMDSKNIKCIPKSPRHKSLLELGAIALNAVFFLFLVHNIWDASLLILQFKPFK